MSQSLSNTKENVTASGLRKFAKEYTMLLFVIVLVIACMLFVDRFATPGNLMNVLIQIAINALIATGMTFVILSIQIPSRSLTFPIHMAGSACAASARFPLLSLS